MVKIPPGGMSKHKSNICKGRYERHGGAYIGPKNQGYRKYYLLGMMTEAVIMPTHSTTH